MCPSLKKTQYHLTRIYVSIQIIIKPSGQGHYQWQAAHDLGVQHSGSLAQLAESLEDTATLVLIAPAETCSLKHYAYEAGEAKLLRQTLPFSLEDELLEDVDDLHFSLGELGDQKAPVAIIKSALLKSWLEAFQEQGLEVQQVVPELMLLPWLEDQWTLTIDEKGIDEADEKTEECRYVLRCGAYQGFALSAAMLPQALSLLVDEQGLPASVVLYCEDSQRDSVKSLLPESIANLVLWQSGSYWSLLLEMLSGLSTESQANSDEHSSLFSLLQGDFARSLPWLKWWLQWRNAVGLLAILVLLQIGLQLSQNNQLEKKNLALRTAIEKAYRQAIPKGAVIDAEKQLRRKVDSMQGGSSEGFVSLLAKIALVMEKVDGFELQVMNYTVKQNEMRLTVLAKSFKDVETVRSSLQKQGLKAELTGSSSDAGKTRARLRIRG